MPLKNNVLINPLEQYMTKLSRYHIYVFSVIFLSKVPIFWHLLNLIFLSPPMDFYCNPETSDGKLVTSEKTKNVCPCEDPWWDRSVFEETMQTKFEVYCDNEWLVSFSQSMSYAGGFVGCLIFGFMSDRFGRVSMFSLSSLLLGVSGCLVSVMPSAASFTCMRFIEGISVGGTVVTSYVLCVEYCGVKHRETITALFHIPLNLGHVTLPIISYLLRDFDEFQLCISLPMFLFAICKFIMMESPKWLMDNDYADDVVDVIEKLNCSHSRTLIQEDVEEFLNAQKHTPAIHKKVKFWHIFRHKRLLLNFCCMCVVYFCCGMGYYGVSQFIGEMSGNIHLNVAISGIMLLPGTIICVFLLRLLKRRTFLISTKFISGIIMLVVVCIPKRWNMMRVIFACICNSFFFMSFIIAYLFSVELFPTSIRNSVIGVLAVLSRVGQILNPPINHISQTVAGVIYGALAVLCGFICFLLPETKNTELPSTLEDSKQLTGGFRQKSNVKVDNTEAELSTSANANNAGTSSAG